MRETASTRAQTRALAPASHFDSFAQQKEASYFGMWLFLAQEIMFFGGLFVAYLVYRWSFPEAFTAGSQELDVLLGGINTAVLIGSSLTMALAVWAAGQEKKKLLVLFLLATMLLGAAFLGIKAVEYSHKWHENHIPGPNFHWEGDGGPQVQMFFNLYFAMTGLHALHMIVGIGLLAFIVIRALQGAYSRENHNFVEGMGLYWHFVDIVWIFLFPLLYLLGRA